MKLSTQRHTRTARNFVNAIVNTVQGRSCRAGGWDRLLPYLCRLFVCVVAILMPFHLKYLANVVAVVQKKKQKQQKI